jgi:hypothetical protein
MILSNGYDTTGPSAKLISLYDLLVTEKLPVIAIEAVLDGFKLRAYDAPKLADRYWYLTTTRSWRSAIAPASTILVASFIVRPTPVWIAWSRRCAHQPSTKCAQPTRKR